MKEAPRGLTAPLRYRLLPLLVLALCLIMTCLVWNHVRHRDETALRDEFNFMADKTVSAIENYLEANVQVLRGVAGLFAASNEVSRREFRHYTETLMLEEHSPGIMGVGFSLLVPGREKERHQHQIRSEGFSDYAISPPGQRDVYTAIVYLEPFSGRNLRAFGYDMYSEPVRRLAMSRARDGGEPALSGKLTLVQETGTDVQDGFLLFLPLYRNGAPHATVVERRASIIGWAYSPLRMKEMMRSLMNGRFIDTGRLITIHVYDGESISPAALMFESQRESHPVACAFEAVRTLHVAGHAWTVRMTSLPAFEAKLSSEKGTIILGVCIGMSLLLALLTWTLVRSREKISVSLASADQANGELAASEERFRSYYELGLIGMAITSPDGGWLQVNDRLCEMLGYSREELVTTRWPDMSHPDDAAAGELLYRQVLAGETEGYTLEKRVIRKDGTIIHVTYSVKCLRHPDGTVRQFVILVDDITSRKQMEAKIHEYSESLESLVRLRTEELEQANRALELNRDRAEASNRAKSMFLAVMSHELRTPLNAILGLSEMLREGIMGNLETEQKNALATIEESGRHLLAVITDILDLSKIEADRLELEIVPVDLEEVCRAALRFVKETAFKKKIPLTFTVRQAPEIVQTDQRRLKQILVNLLSNAVKFTPEGGAISLEVTGDEALREVRFTVLDTGIGISPDNLEKLFQPFVQVDDSLNRRFEGTGLGLTLVARLTALLGGKVSVASTPGEGSRFTVILPLPEESRGDVAPAPLLEAGPATAGNSFTTEPLILLVEDSPTSREMLRDYLQSLGCRVVTAVTGIEAVAQARDQNPALILMDIQLPVMDGMTAIRTIRALPPPGNGVPIIALTALAMQGDMDRCLESGADDYLSKPFRLQELHAMIAELLGHGER